MKKKIVTQSTLLNVSVTRFVCFSRSDIVQQHQDRGDRGGLQTQPPGDDEGGDDAANDKE
jgi:hypothetical protein